MCYTQGEAERPCAAAPECKLIDKVTKKILKITEF